MKIPCDRCGQRRSFALYPYCASCWNGLPREFRDEFQSARVGHDRERLEEIQQIIRDTDGLPVGVFATPTAPATPVPLPERVAPLPTDAPTQPQQRRPSPRTDRRSFPPSSVGPRARQLLLEVERLDGGKLRLTTPTTPGFAAVVRGPHEIARALNQLWTEQDVAAYARWRGTVYDHDDGPPPRSEPPPRAPLAGPHPVAASAGERGWRRGQVRPDTFDPASWTVLPDGRLRSPGGLTYKRDSTMGQRVLRRRAALDLPCNP